MKCIDCEKLIVPFLNEELKEDALREFVEHINICGSCKEELTIHFLAKEGINMIEDDKAFDLDKELQSLLEQSLKQYDRKHLIIRSFIFTEILAILIIVAILLYVGL